MTEKYHSPFMVFNEFLSAKLCEEIVSDAFSKKNHDWLAHPLSDRLNTVIPLIESHYQCKHRDTNEILFEKYAENASLPAHSENSTFLDGKWIRTKDRDYTAILFLSDYNDEPPFDSRYEVYGGKMEFPQWNFGFQPVRGTLIIFPSDPHFLNQINKIQSGTYYRAVVHFNTVDPFIYDSKNFSGTYKNWF